MNETETGFSVNRQATPRAMISPGEALDLVTACAAGRPPVCMPIFDALGLASAESVLADRDYPPFDRAMMDGYAVSEGAAGQELKIIGEAAAGQPANSGPDKGCCIEIMTGAPCPPGTFAVVQKEHVNRSGDKVSMPDSITPGQHIALKGSECRAGDVVLKTGQRIDSFAIAVLATIGKTTVSAIRRPRLGIISTGTELVAADAQPDQFQIRDGNGPMLAAMACGVGIERPAMLTVKDDMRQILDNLELIANCDIVLFTGGVSVGRYDLVPEALRLYEAEVIFHKVAQKPGKPLLLARRGGQLLFGLPGNPLACHFCFHRYVAAAVRKMQGHNPVRTVYYGRLKEPVERKRGRRYFVPGVVESPAAPGEPPLVRPLPGKSSADIFQSSGANCYLEIAPGPAPVPMGDIVGFTFFDGV